MVVITENDESHITKQVSNIDEVYNILSNYWKETDVISKAFYTAYEMLNGSFEGTETYCNEFSGFIIEVSTRK